MADTNLIEVAMYNYLSPKLAALSPAWSFQWGIVPPGTTDYVELAGVGGATNNVDDFESARLQFSIVTERGMSSAATVRELLKGWLQRAKGVFSGLEIENITHVRSIDLPNPTTGESIITSEYQINYQGVI